MFRGNGDASGFQMTFANGWTVSVQWHFVHMCSNRYKQIKQTVMDPDHAPPTWTAEIAAWKGANMEGPIGYCDPEKVVSFMDMICKK